MLADVAWLVLHGGHAGNEGLLTFEAMLGSLVALLAVAGALVYLGVVDLPDGSADDPESGAGD